jgi:hypothetical protein
MRLIRERAYYARRKQNDEGGYGQMGRREERE